MESNQFDDLARRLVTPASRRTSLRSLAGAFAGGALALFGISGTEAGKKKKKKGSNQQGPQCGDVTCPVGQVCCPDQKCGTRCCANGRACNVVCSGPNGNDYCCDASRPEPICGGCWQAGSTQCATPGHCCGPNQVCCGDDHCCDIETQECRINCYGVVGSNSCCIKGSGPGCCPQV